MSKRSFAAASVAAAACCAAAWAATNPPGNPASFTDMTTPGTNHTTTLAAEADGSIRTVSTVDGHFDGVGGALAGPFNTTILRVTHPNGVRDTSGVDWCYACTDLNGKTGAIGNHLIGVTGSPTHTVLGSGTDGLVNDRGTFTLVPGTPLTDVGFLSTSPCLIGHRAGRLVVGSGESVCLAPGAKVSGGVTVESNGELFANGATISGGVRADGPAAISLCGTRISGPLSISGAQFPVLVGEPFALDAIYSVHCPGNTISGPVSLMNNVGGVDFSGNTVSGPVTATNNTGGFMFGDFAPNTIAGPITASGNV